MPREHMDFVKGVFPTPFGDMDWTLTEANHVSISSGSSYDTTPPIVINGVDYKTNIHLFYDPRTDTWGQRADGTRLYMSRAGSFSQSDYTQSAFNKASVGIAKAWNEYARNLEIPRLEAEKAHVNNEIISTQEELNKARVAMEQWENKMEELLAHELDVDEQLGRSIRKGGYPARQDWSPRGRRPD